MNRVYCARCGKRLSGKKHLRPGRRTVSHILFHWRLAHGLYARLQPESNFDRTRHWEHVLPRPRCAACARE